MLKKYFCISDVHSFYDELIEALTKKGFDMNDPTMVVIICGDAFDRGEQSLEVYEFMKTLADQGRLIYIRGNHEDLLFDCVHELAQYGRASSHHYSNGTVKTISHFLKEDDFWMYSTYIPTNATKMIYDSTEELRNFISQNCRDYFILGNKIFVHSWLPTINNQLVENWQSSPEDDPILMEAWENARWGNPFELWKAGLYLKDSCIVFGHFHTSYYWSHIKQERKEFPQKNQQGWSRSFDPVIESNFIALDACCAYSGKINCVVFDENGNLLNY